MDETQLTIVGGGPAGMAAALIAGRARVNTLVVDARAPRNAVAHASHGFLTRDGYHSSELHELALEQLQKYPTVRYVCERVDSVVAREAGGFGIVTGSGQTWSSARVVFATGLRTELSDLQIPDIDEVYGRSVFPCPFCDGFEVADRPLAIFGTGAAAHMATLLQMWSRDVIVFTNGEPLPREDREVIESSGVTIEDAKIDRLEHDDGQLRNVVVAERTIGRHAGFLVDPHASLATDLPTRLGVDTAPHPFMGDEHYVADEFGKTGVDHIYVVGDLKRVFGGITAAAHDGYLCAAGIVNEIASEGRPTHPN